MSQMPGSWPGHRPRGGNITLLEDPVEAVRDADCVITDAWASMGDDDEARERRREHFLPYQVDVGLMSNAGKDAIFLHCLPALSW